MNELTQEVKPVSKGVLKQILKEFSIFSSFERIKNLSVRALDPKGIKEKTQSMIDMAIPVARTYRKECFEEAIARQGISEQDLLNIEYVFTKRVLVVRSIFYLTLFFLFFYVILFWPGLVLLLAMIISLMVLGSLLFRSSFRLWQVQNRELGLIRDFFKEDGLYKMFVKDCPRITS